MAVIRVSKAKGFTVMSNYHLRDKNLSLKAKGLLSMMLALPDGWHYNVRGLASICKEGVTSISSTLRELADCGYVRRHQPVVDGKFQEIEYVIYEFPQHTTSDDGGDGAGNDDSSTGTSAEDAPIEGACPESASDAAAVSQDAKRPVSSRVGSPHTEPPHTASPCSDAPCTENPYTGNPHMEDAHTDSLNAYINIDSRNTERVNTDQSNYPSINQRGMGAPAADRRTRADGMDAMGSSDSDLLLQLGAQRETDVFSECRDFVKDSIEFEALCQMHEYDRDTIEGIVELMVETICSKAPFVRIGGQDYPQAVVKSRLLKLDQSHIEYVLTCLSKNTTKVRNMKQYLLTTLYNAPTTIGPYYQNWVLNDNPEFAG